MRGKCGGMKYLLRASAFFCALLQTPLALADEYSSTVHVTSCHTVYESFTNQAEVSRNVEVRITSPFQVEFEGVPIQNPRIFLALREQFSEDITQDVETVFGGAIHDPVLPQQLRDKYCKPRYRPIGKLGA